MKRVLFLSLGLALSSQAQELVDFSKSIVPILRDHCLSCHGPDKAKADLRVDTREAAMKGSKHGAVLKAGDAAASDFYKRVILPKGHDDIMPPEGEPLSKAQTDLLKAWIDQGAKWPDGVTIAAPAAAAPAPVASARATGPRRPDPVLPKDFKPAAGEAAAVATLGQAGIGVRPIASNSPWREANFRLQGASVTDATLAPLKEITSLVELNLANTKITDNGLAVLKSLPHVMNLHLELTGVTDAGLEHVKSLSNLVYLNLYGTQVTDAGLEHLKGLKHLQRLYLWQSKVTPAAAKKLAEAMPGLDVNTGWELPPAPPATNAAPAKTEEKKTDEKKPEAKKEEKK